MAGHRARGIWVSAIRRKQPHLRLEAKEYKLLRAQVLAGDGWRCQTCGARCNLQVHHKKSRGRLGHDHADDLITLCAAYQEATHPIAINPTRRMSG